MRMYARVARLPRVVVQCVCRSPDGRGNRQLIPLRPRVVASRAWYTPSASKRIATWLDGTGVITIGQIVTSISEIGKVRAAAAACIAKRPRLAAAGRRRISTKPLAGTQIALWAAKETVLDGVHHRFPVPA